MRPGDLDRHNNRAMSVPRSLLRLNSWLAEQLIDYCRVIDEALSRNGLLERLGRRFGDLEQPLKVIPFDMAAELREVERREHLREVPRRDSGERDDRHGGIEEIYAPRDRRPEVRPEPLETASARLDLLMLLGDPGSGKSTFTRKLAIKSARAAREALERHTVLPDAVALPVFLRLSDLGAELGDEAVLCHLLVEIGAVDTLPSQLTSQQRVAAGIVRALRRRFPADQYPALGGFIWHKQVRQKKVLTRGSSMALRRFANIGNAKSLPVLARNRS